MNPDSAKNATVTAPLAAVNLGVSEQSDVEHRMATSPLQSTGGVLGSREGGTTPATRMAIPAATGAMNRKTLPHQNRSRSQPPTIGPSAIPTPVVAPHIPIARALDVVGERWSLRSRRRLPEPSTSSLSVAGSSNPSS